MTPRQPVPPSRPFWVRFMNGVVDPPVATILRSPVHPLLSRWIALLEIRGSRTGRTFRLPVIYSQGEAGSILIRVGAPASKLWWRNLREPAPVVAWIRGERLETVGRAHVEGDRVDVRLDPRG